MSKHKQVCLNCKRKGSLGKAFPGGGGHYCSPKCLGEYKLRRSQNKTSGYRPKPLSDAGFVYFVEGRGLVKIGTALDPTKRLKSLQVGSPTPLKLLGFYPGGEKRERVLHLRFAACREHGEWFDALKDKSLFDEIDKARGYMNTSS